jgi:hypothetical protein
MKEINVRELFDDELYNKSEEEIRRFRRGRKARESFASISMIVGIGIFLLNVLSVLVMPDLVINTILTLSNAGFLLLTTVLMDRYHPASALFLAVYVITNIMNVFVMTVSGISVIYNLIFFSVIVLTFVIIRRHKRI